MNWSNFLLTAFLCSALAEVILPSCSNAAASDAQTQIAAQKPGVGPLGNTQDANRLLERAKELNQKALDLYDKVLYQEALPLAEEALKIREQVLGPTHLDVAASLNTLGLILHQQVRLDNAQRHLNRALEIREGQLGAGHPDVAESLTNLARVMYAGGDFAKAQPLLERAIDIRQKTVGKSHPDSAVSLAHLGVVQSQMGNLSGAQKTLENAVGILESAKDTRAVDLAMALSRLGNVRGRLGDFAGARTSLERSLQIREQVLGATHPHVARSLTQLAYLLEKTGETRKALGLAERAFEINKQSLGPYHAEIAGNLNDLARLSDELNDANAALDFFERALKVQKQTVGSKHPFVAETLRGMAEVSRKLGNISPARELLETALQIQHDSLGAEHILLANTITSMAYLEAGAKNFNKAQSLFKRALEIRERSLGPNHPDVALSLNNLALALQLQEKLDEARPLYERARLIHLAMGRLNENLDDTALIDVWNRGLQGLRHYAGLLARIGRPLTPDQNGKSAREDAFVVAEQSRLGIAHVAIGRAAARSAAGDFETVALLRQVQDLRNRRQSVNSQLTIEYGKTAEVNPKLVHQLRVKSEQLERDLKIAVARLNAANPTYAELASPEPINIVAVRRLLRKAEALISFWVLNDRLLIWLIRPDEGLIYNDFQIDRATLLKVVKRVRTSLDQSDNLGFANVKPAAFDVSGANLLYRSLFGSLEAHLQGVKHLIIVPDEILLPLPFGALLTNNKDDSFKKSVDLFKKNARLSPQELANYRQLPWLISQYAITVLPSASSLRALREIVDRSVKQGETEPFIGFGDPLLEGDDGLRGGAMIDTRGSAFSLRDIRKLSRLPGTRTELIAIATTLGADPKRALYLSDRATEPMIRKLNDSRVLAKSRVIAFATHGLLAGQLTGLKQPALVLTPPKNLSEHDNGLLELDEILALKLDRAEWAILSACNTGATDGSGDGLAGLVRAFLFSGAKSLLVSHWNVDDSATQALMAEVFRQYTNEKNVSRAEALRQGMLAVMNNTRDNKPYFAHPFAWAPFFLVGEGSASRN